MNWQTTLITMMQKSRHIIFDPGVKVMKNISLGKATRKTSILEERVGNIGWCKSQLCKPIPTEVESTCYCTNQHLKENFLQVCNS